MATTVARSQPSVRFESWPNATSAIPVTSLSTGGSQTCGICATRGSPSSSKLDGRERAVTLTERGHHLLETHRRDREDARDQAFYAGVSRPRELSHDVQLYR